ncbi:MULTISPECIES: glycerol-3-phosphate 1-O-acyltransferase PlsY [unclassified Novosphingobium]|uniref:glycerol-3-phosphate 1-O-acyltransferase PlsY n=1 Tax=unclassified Novosphingobium TaxID=2644732 RepID=UPI000D312A19|nr:MULTISPECIES: glycerol-3-phosphate 1-O-acyltransferase PlsY [unclassified Novosphingobium]PTR11685.1 acyl-phosphate glycerol-3-phosphate acyltransferase [Novosphingobium sp. GV055]PUB04725.1 acyl-phosphate glycerol-3-phosphate acyltransferase [Novosphingobium sp. GV061]PUB21044.1 acyl-phosphate glycerol-3-phosphate acyltransferase [Novosphingobium sp. GV079]PUB42770.1 acyl-phosphate glycerol-3-phosphate acyltransferase [Novosphingobium sp. GV027]
MTHDLALPACILAYLLGAIPFGLILTRLTGAGDLRAIGSGNIGATNVLRTGRKGLAASTLLLDLLKGSVAVWLARAYAPGTEALVALAAVIGHCFPLWLRFKGGKGVATTMGVALGLAWPIGLAYAVVWLGMLALVRISSVGGMSAVVVAPLAALAIGRSDYALVLAVIAALVIFLHRANIARLLAGTEPKIGGKKPTGKDAA